MRKIYLLLVLIIIFIASSFTIYLINIDILKSNKEHYSYFKDEKLVGVDGKINLSSIKAENEGLNRELIEMFEVDNYNYDTYLKILEYKRNINNNIEKEINNLSSEISSLESKKLSLNSEYNVLVKKYDSLKKKYNASIVSNNSYKFPLINQNPNYPIGCESVALTMLLKYHGVNVTPDMVIARLKKGSVPYYENGIMYGGNPELEFVGNPYSKYSYGVYEKPIIEVANSFKIGIKGGSNFSFSEVINLVKNGTPVMVWTSSGLSLPYISKIWIYKPTGESISWKANEHAVVIVDANDSSVIIVDPIGGKLKTYSRSLFEQRYNYYGKKALYY